MPSLLCLRQDVRIRRAQGIPLFPDFCGRFPKAGSRSDAQNLPLRRHPLRWKALGRRAVSARWRRSENDIDILVNNITNFQHWCASRILTLDRQYAKAILNSIGASQAFTDRERAGIALTYRCLSLTDIFWVRQKNEKVTFDEVNLYENHLDNALVDVSLRGKRLAVHNKHLEKEFAKDLSTNGCYPKAWIRKGDHFQLYKDGGRRIVENEVLASKVCHRAGLVYRQGKGL